MRTNRRVFLSGFGGALALPMLDAHAAERKGPPLRLLIVGNPFGMHPDHFFPKRQGKDFAFPKTLKSLAWLKNRLTILSHTDHSMKSGHGREIAFLNGVLPETSGSLPEKNMSLDQVIARQIGSGVRFRYVHAAVGGGIRMSWNGNGVELKPIADPQKLFDHLFRNLSPKEKARRRDVIGRNNGILDAVRGQLADVRKNVGRDDRERLDQFATSVRELEKNLAVRRQWVDRDKPRFNISQHLSGGNVTIENKYSAIFDMIAYAFQTDLTRVATVSFPSSLSYTAIDGVTRGYHACTHNGRKENLVDQLVAIEAFQISQLSRCLKRLDAVKEPASGGTLLDNTVVLFGSGMGYGGTHSNRNLPILVAGGGFKHRGHVETRNNSGQNMPLCNLYVTLMQRFGIERDRFNSSTGTFELRYD